MIQVLSFRSKYADNRHKLAYLLSLQNSFVSLFGGPSSDFGERLYRFFFDKGAEVQDVIAVDKDLFVTAMNQLHTVLFCNSKEEKYHFLISLFFRSKDHLKLSTIYLTFNVVGAYSVFFPTDLLALLHTALSCALHVGLAIDISIPTTDHHLLSLAAAIVCVCPEFMLPMLVYIVTLLLDATYRASRGGVRTCGFSAMANYAFTKSF